MVARRFGKYPSQFDREQSEGLLSSTNTKMILLNSNFDRNGSRGFTSQRLMTPLVETALRNLLASTGELGVGYDRVSGLREYTSLSYSFTQALEFPVGEVLAARSSDGDAMRDDNALLVWMPLGQAARAAAYNFRYQR